MLQSVYNCLRSTFGLAMLGAVLLWAALPPLDITPLAWLAPIFWVALVRTEKLPQLELRARPARGRPWLLLMSAVLLFAAGMCVTEWFHERQYQMFWAADTVFWLAAIALVVWAARRWAAHPYRSLWLAGMFFWLADLHWLRLPYWAIGFGWLALGIYFGCYLPLFVALSRIGVHRLRLPVILIAPAVWTGLELTQAHLLSGMTMGCLEHTQFRWTNLIQISDVTGSYGVAFLMMFVAACLARMLPLPGTVRSMVGRGAGGEETARRWSIWPLLPAAGVLAAALVYGHWRTSQAEIAPVLKIALIQGNIDIRLHSPEGFHKKIDDEYRSLTRDALAKFPQADLIVWPEAVFGCVDPATGDFIPWITGDEVAKTPDDFGSFSGRTFREVLDDKKQVTLDVMTHTAVDFGRPMIVGVDREHYGADGREVFNSGVLITPDGRWFQRPPDRYFYDKTHLVPFGEYMPFANWFPWLQYLSPLGSGSSASDRSACFVVKNINLLPNICYESTLPHVIRNQMVALRQEGVEPQILVNLTNDGWFWGSSELEMHLACGVFRTVENRRPMVIAANTGISAWIDGNGSIVAEGPKHATGVIAADVRLDRRESWYSLHGDWFAGSCLVATIGLAAVGIYASRSRREQK
jgi:apolipoprotein N-acyltransferase